ncbi:MAG: helix-turn-helix transcriptional regulator [Acidobacteria bacterium]|nr:helix-turn-helix transcriptional regulator [Acidobacteriota bacterium]
MLIPNVQRMMRLRGIEKYYSFLTGLGFVPSTARDILKGVISALKFDQIEKLCLALNCTPNDLLDWQPGKKQAVAETHSLNALKRAAGGDELPQILSELPTDKIAQLVEVLKDFKGSPK